MVMTEGDVSEGARTFLLNVYGDGPQGHLDYEVLCVEVKANYKPKKSRVDTMRQIPVPSEVWVHRDRARVWDVYEPKPSGLKLVRNEPYVSR